MQVPLKRFKSAEQEEHEEYVVSQVKQGDWHKIHSEPDKK